MTNHTIAQVILASVLEARGRKITPHQATIWSCIITAVLDVAPDFIASLFNCLSQTNGGNGDDTGAYNPGHRQRCQ